MDPIATALTVAWLDAFRRVQSPPHLDIDSHAPAATLTDAIERALRDGAQDGTVEPPNEGRLLDRTV